MYDSAFWIQVILICIMGIIPPAITSAILGYLMYEYGRRKAEKIGKIQQELVKNEIKKEIKEYIQNELIGDVKVAIENTLRGILGPIGKGGAEETRLAMLEAGKNNPGIMNVIYGTAIRGGARWVGKQLGVKKEEIDQIISGSGVPMIGSGQKDRTRSIIDQWKEIREESGSQKPGPKGSGGIPLP